MHKKQFTHPPRRVGLFVTCMVDMIYPAVGMATVELLERLGVETIFPTEQTCCGQPAFHAGYRAEARTLAERFINIFEPLVRGGQIDAIVMPSGSCATMTSHFYNILFEDQPMSPFYKRAQTLAEVTFELTEFLVDVLGANDVGSRFQGKVTYHACCQLLRELEIDQQPRQLLANIASAEVVELNEAADCCGFGGLFALNNAAISTAMGQRKTRNLAASDADIVALCDVSCMTHINGLLSRQAQRCRAVHIAEVLNSQVDVAPREPSTPVTIPERAPRRWQDAKV